MGTRDWEQRAREERVRTTGALSSSEGYRAPGVVTGTPELGGEKKIEQGRHVVLSLR